MNIDSDGNPEPNNRQSAVCSECGNRRSLNAMSRKDWYCRNETIVTYHCKDTFCSNQALRMPGKVERLMKGIVRKTNEDY